MEKCQCLKMTKTHGKDYVSQKVVFYGLRKTMIPSQSS